MLSCKDGGRGTSVSPVRRQKAHSRSNTESSVKTNISSNWGSPMTWRSKRRGHRSGTCRKQPLLPGLRQSTRGRNTSAEGPLAPRPFSPAQLFRPPRGECGLRPLDDREAHRGAVPCWPRPLGGCPRGGAAQSHRADTTGVPRATGAAGRSTVVLGSEAPSSSSVASAPSTAIAECWQLVREDYPGVTSRTMKGGFGANRQKASALTITQSFVFICN